ncbi:response regulator [Patescibacteria group bacterium]|nr:response regulator [Patescibacteria group bacterium]
MRNKRILAVDDDAFIRRAVRRIWRVALEDAGLDPEEAECAQDAYDLVARTPDDAWFVLTDFQMPSNPGDELCNGADLIRALRRNPVLRQPHIVLMTGVEPDATGIVGCGYDVFFPKTIEKELLLAELRMFLASD